MHHVGFVANDAFVEFFLEARIWPKMHPKYTPRNLSKMHVWRVHATPRYLYATPMLPVEFVALYVFA